MSLSYTCDRCGCVIPAPPSVLVLVRPADEGRRYDLCRACVELLLARLTRDARTLDAVRQGPEG